MEQLPILILVLTLVAGFICVGIIARSAYNRPSKVLRTFTNAILVYNLAMVVWFLINYHEVNFKNVFSKETSWYIFKILNFIDSVLVILWGYIYFLFITEIVEEFNFDGIRKKVKTVLVSSAALLAFSFLITFITGKGAYSFYVREIAISLNLIFTMVLTGWVFSLSLKKEKTKKNRGTLFFTGSFIIILNLFIIHKVVFYFFINPFLSQLTEVIIELFVNIISVVWVLMWADYYSGAVNSNYISAPLQSITLDDNNFTEREKEIIRLLCSGKSNQDIADLLFISIKTVKSHVYNIFQKTKVKNRTQLAQLFINRSAEKI